MDKSPKPSKAQAPQSGLVHRMFGLRVGGSQPRADKDAGERKAADSGTVRNVADSCTRARRLAAGTLGWLPGVSHH